ncbi:DUF2171 domain-containing protein [Sphingomonas sp. KR1UV-12]|uniref:DUF2171 domain-containing protein n=2 Tax=Sphingomonas aurea TaxID=3063994 RepID=A0ABT9EFU6_9SPHN|nr:DUF2171 domain-containing protein [Sphingomonas sp. KR1UV-12]
MGYERYPRGNYQDDYTTSSGAQDYGPDYGTGRDYTYSSARDYAAAGRLDEHDGRQDRYGRREYGNQRYAQRDRVGGQQGGYGRQDYGRQDTGRYDQGRSDYGRQQQGGGYGRQDRYGTQARSGGEYRGSYASDGHRFEDVGRYAHADDDNYRGRQQQQGRGGYGRQPQGYDYEDRGFFQRAGDEVRSWFGDDDAERRREADARYDERYYAGGQHDQDYHGWRSGQIAALDRDYDEYRQENRSRFEQEFSTWRTGRQGQRDLLKKVTEHQEVVGSDGAHVGTVDKVRGDRILLTKNDADAGGQHHSIPSRWITSVDDKVTLSKSADEAKQAWRDEDRQSAMFGYGDNSRSGGSNDRPDDGKTNLNRSFSGTY